MDSQLSTLRSQPARHQVHFSFLRGSGGGALSQRPGHRSAVGNRRSAHACKTLRCAPRHRRAFSLLEVVAAIGIFAIGMVAVIGLFAPVAKSVGGTADAEAAANVADLLRSRLQGMGISAATLLLKSSTAKSHELTDADAKPDYDITKDAQLLFASRDGTRIGGYNDPVWRDPVTLQPSDTGKFFEIALVRNETLSPVPVSDADPAPPPPLVLAYTARIRWPAFVPDATPTNSRRALPAGFNPSGAVRFDHSQKQAVFFAGSVTR